MVRFALSLIMLLAFSACTPLQGTESQPEGQDPTPTGMGETQPPAPGETSATPEPDQAATHSLPSKEQRLTAVPPGQIERVPAETPAFVTGEVPVELLDAIQADIIEKIGKQPQTIELLQAVMTTWTDGSLGCPQPGMYYTQALVDGYHVLFVVDGETFDYRASDRGYFFRCEQSGPGGTGIMPPKIPPTITQ